MVENDRATSVCLSRFLSDVYGSEDDVKVRRTFYSATEILKRNDIIQVIPSGSRAEGLQMHGSDFDIMFLYRHAHVYETLSNITTISEKTVSIIMDYDDTKLGFTRLRLLQYDGIDGAVSFFRERSISYGGIQYISSSSIRDHGAHTNTVPHGPCRMAKAGTFENDMLHCFRCKQWISLVSPWTIRRRGSWPSTQLISDITQYGVLFVPVGCKTSRYEDIEWRISFSIAEKQLIHSFTHTQFLCYAMMKALISDIIKKQHKELLCSYFIKTIMFWLSEENDSEFWVPDNLIHCYMTCLKRLIYCVQYRICLLYFIPEINFFEDRFSDTEQEALLNSLYTMYCKGWGVILNTKTILHFRLKVLFNYIKGYHLSKNNQIASSVFLPVDLIKIAFAQNNVSKYLYSLSPFITCARSSTRRVFLYIDSLGRYGQVSGNTSFQVTSGNKLLYNQYKSILSDTLISTRVDCVSGWCLLASLFYKLKIYNRCNDIIGDCLRKCTPDKTLINSALYIWIPSNIKSLYSNRRHFTSILQHWFFGRVQFHSVSLLPDELLMFETEIRNNEFVFIPTVVYLHFLNFICFHHQKQDRAKKIAFRNLQSTVEEKYFIENDSQMTMARRILDVAFNMLHLT